MRTPAPSAISFVRAGRLALPSTWRSLAREALWSMRDVSAPPPEPTWHPQVSLLPATTVIWPDAYRWPPQANWVEPIRLGLERLVRVEKGPVFSALPQEVVGVVPFKLRVGGRTLEIAIDYGDDTRLDPFLNSNFDLVFKMQYLAEGYDSEFVVPGGFVPNSMSLYRYLPRLRKLRDTDRSTIDVYGRFGKDKRLDIRESGVELLKKQRSFTYRGGFGRVRYVEALVQAARARVALDLPGLGPFCFRLVDSLAIGLPIVSPRHAARLHVPLEDGRHILFCSEDLSDLVQTIERVLSDGRVASRLAAEARAFFDRYLDFRQLAGYYLATSFERL